MKEDGGGDKRETGKQVTQEQRGGVLVNINRLSLTELAEIMRITIITAKSNTVAANMAREECTSEALWSGCIVKKHSIGTFLNVF